LLYPVPKFKPLKVLEAIAVTLGRLIAFRVLDPPPVMAVPVGVTDKPFVVTAPAPALVFVKVRLARFAPVVVKEESARVKMFPDAVVEVIDVVPKPVKAIDPDVPVRLNAPVVRVRPLLAVKADEKDPVEENVAAPVTARVEESVTAPLRLIAPVPVEKVPVPDIAKFPEDWVYPVIPESAPADETSKLVESITSGAEPPPIVTVPVEVPVLIFVAKFEEALMDAIPPEVVKVPVLVRPVDETVPEVEIVVIPDKAPAAVKTTVPELIKFVYPVPKFNPLKVLLVAAETAPKLMPFKVFDPVAFAVPVSETL